MSEVKIQPGHKQNLVGISILLILVGVGAYYLGATNQKSAEIITPDSSIQQNTSNLLNQSGEGVYDYTEASNHIGEIVGIRGTVAKVYTSRKGTIFFDYCTDYKGCPFSAVIFASNASNFSNPYQYQGKTIIVRGFVKTYQGRAEIILDSPNRISE